MILSQQPFRFYEWILNCLIKISFICLKNEDNYKLCISNQFEFFVGIIIDFELIQQIDRIVVFFNIICKLANWCLIIKYIVRYFIDDTTFGFLCGKKHFFPHKFKFWFIEI